jgi:dolichol-phosphate mannosyltransferase
LILARRLPTLGAVPVEISIVVPVYEEEDNIQPLASQVLEAMSAQGRTFELVFVDDASKDRTWERILEAGRRDPRVKGLRHERNAGQSAAFWTGVRATASPILATLDGDLQNDPADLPRMLVELENVDFVCGVRTERQDSWVRRVSSRVARAARRWALGVDFRDTGCFLRVFRRRALDGVVPFNGWHRFLPVLVHASGATTREVPVHHRPRVAGLSKYGVWNRLGRGVFDLVGVAWIQKRQLRPVSLAPSVALSPDRPGAAPPEASPGL